MAESTPKAQKKIKSFFPQSNGCESSLEQTPTKSPKKKSESTNKRKSKGSSDSEVPNKTLKIERQNASNDSVETSTKSTTEKQWTFEEEELLFEKVGEYLEYNESQSTKKTFYLKDIDWTKIGVCGNHTVQEAQTRFLVISNRVRKMRTAREILTDMKLVHLKKITVPKKKNIDPDLPKKPLTAYFQYLKAKRAKLVEKHPEMKNLEITKKLCRRWQRLSEEKKKKYSEIYQQEMDEYHQKMVVYLTNANPDVEPPLSAFDLWSVEETKAIKSEKPDISNRKLQKKLTRRWNNVEDSEKIKWDQLEKKEYSKFKKRVLISQKKAQAQQ